MLIITNEDRYQGPGALCRVLRSTDKRYYVEVVASLRRSFRDQAWERTAEWFDAGSVKGSRDHYVAQEDVLARDVTPEQYEAYVQALMARHERERQARELYDAALEDARGSFEAACITALGIEALP